MSEFKQKLYLGVLFTAAIFISCRIVYSYLANPQLFPINKIKVSASYKHVSQQQIKQLASGYAHESFFSLPSRQLRAKIKLIPWVKDVRISRQWPDTMKIQISEKQAVARFNEAGLITDSGLVFFPPLDTINESLPVLLGPNRQHKQMFLMFNKLAKLASEGQLSIKTLALTHSQAWTVNLNNGIKIELGKKHALVRFARFIKVYGSDFEPRAKDISSIDLRYPSGLAVRWK